LQIYSLFEPTWIIWDNLESNAGLLSNLYRWLPPGSISASLSDKCAMQHDTLFFSRNMNPFAATCSEVGIDVCFSSSSWWYRSCNSYKVSLTICYRNHMSRNRLQTSTHNWTVPSASDVADWMYYKRIHVFLRAGSSNSPQIWGHSCTIVNAVSWCTGQIFICAPLSSNSQPTWACRWFHWKPGLHVQSACHESCVTTWFGTICYL